MKLHHTISPQCGSVNSASDLRHALHGLIQKLSVYQSEHCIMRAQCDSFCSFYCLCGIQMNLRSTMYVIPAQRFVIMLSGNRTAPHHIGMVQYGEASIVLKFIPSFRKFSVEMYLI